MASVRPKGRGFEARVTINGKPLSKVHCSIEEAQRWITGLKLGFITKGNHNAYSMTLKEACQRYAKEVVIHHKGARQEYSRLKQIQALGFAEKPLSSIGQSELKAYRDDLIARGLSGSTVRLNLALISAIFSHAKKEWAVNTDNPALTIKKPKPGKARSRRLLPGEEERLMKALTQCRNPHVERTIRFMLETGLRKSEALNLTWADLDLDTGVVVIRESKNGSARWVPLSVAAISSCKTLQTRSERPFPITPSALDQAWGHALKRAGILDLRIHDLRHEALSRWARIVRGDIFLLSSLSGHKSLAMVQRYVHRTAAEQMAYNLSIS